LCCFVLYCFVLCCIVRWYFFPCLISICVCSFFVLILFLNWFSIWRQCDCHYHLRVGSETSTLFAIDYKCGWAQIQRSACLVTMRIVEFGPTHIYNQLQTKSMFRSQHEDDSDNRIVFI
jgi:hypothetical protein